MANHARKVLRMEVAKDGKTSLLEKPTILRTPDSKSTGGVAAPQQPCVRVELSTSRPLSLSDLGDRSAPSLQLPMMRGASSSVPKKSTAAKPTKVMKREVVAPLRSGGTLVMKKAEAIGRVIKKVEAMAPKRKAAPSKVKESTSDQHPETIGNIGPSPKYFTPALRDQVLIEDLKNEVMMAGTSSSPFDEEAYYKTLAAELEKRTTPKQVRRTEPVR